jgi:PAS domain-containing protein
VTKNADLARTVIEYSFDGLLVIDAEGFVQFANPAAISMFRHQTDQLTGFHIGVPAINEPVEITLPGLNGACHVEMRSTEMVWEGRAANLACLRDITDRKKAEEAVRKQAEELRERNHELIRFNSAAVGRELRMIELKQEVNQLCVCMGHSVRYRVTEDSTILPASTSDQV